MSTPRFQVGGHAATSALWPDRWIMKSAACCALLAAVKTARLSALRTFSHDAMYWA